MNVAQRIVLLVALLIAVLMVLFPPWIYTGRDGGSGITYGWIFSPRPEHVEIKGKYYTHTAALDRWLVMGQISILILGAAFGFVAFGHKKQSPRD